MLKEKRKQMAGPEERVCYRIAGRVLALYCSESLQISAYLPGFKPFLEISPGPEEEMIQVDILTSGAEDQEGGKRLLSNISALWKGGFRFEESGHGYNTSVRNETTGKVWGMISSKDFKHSTIFAEAGEFGQCSILSWMLMVVYGQAVLAYKSVLVHASVVETEGKGFAFLGKSGTGKSTHSGLWLTHIAGSALLNDDNPVISIDEHGKVWIHGSPWSGKTDCYRNECVELGGLIRLRQAGQNRWIDIGRGEGLLALVPSCTSIRWNKKQFSKMVDIVEEISGKVPIACMDCLPDKEAVDLCYQKITVGLSSRSDDGLID